MTESPSESVSESRIIDNNENNHHSGLPEISIDIVSEEEMGLLEAALASARSSFTSSVIAPAIRSTHFQSNVRSIQSITVLSKRGISSLAGADIEDSGDFRSTQKKIRLPDSFFLRFRKKKGLSVTDVTATEWCEKQMEFALLGKRKITRAMRKGSARHAKLEEEVCFRNLFWLFQNYVVVKKVKVRITTMEDRWALKLLNFIIGINQFLFEGLTRELPLVSFVEGVWMVGVIDEVQMPTTETDSRNPVLVETKTRVQDKLPSEPQRRNGRLQLMCYKHMWDSLVADKFPTAKFFDFFLRSLFYLFSLWILHYSCKKAQKQNLGDLAFISKRVWHSLVADEPLMMSRYKFQKDQSVLSEDQFSHDSDWVKKHLLAYVWQQEGGGENMESVFDEIYSCWKSRETNFCVCTVDSIVCNL
ncbi:hypothetical protein FNV43_RR04434 [Rhamnella rubrinervis]|uniref:Uncharacterized protein n=1 Tax=Rhamnella rubrinervis TaxID=2594499 RepID=A0A8K0HJJ5_9ROSA|nr:hypothetical protein FNV43_RR04434 [Rhamnella rubrinervis]